MQESGPYGSKWAKIDQSGPKWADLNPSGLKCYADMNQLERSNDKCKTLVFRYYINMSY